MSSIRNIFFVLFLIIFISGCTHDHKENHSHSHEKTTYSYMGNIERSIDLKLFLDKSKISVIKATVSLPYDYPHKLAYKWKLGQDVQLASDSHLSGEISSLSKNQTVDIYLKVENFDSNKNRFVRFEIFGTDPNKRVFSDGLVSSHQENSFEYIVQEVEKINEKK